MNFIKVTDRDARAGRTLFLLSRCSHSPLYARKVLYTPVYLLLFLCTSFTYAGSRLELTTDTVSATAGYYHLAWFWSDATTETNYVLVETSHAGDNGGGREIYYGPDLATVISGKPDGSYHYLVRAIDPKQVIVAESEQVEVVVAHHSLHRAFAFFILGAVVFVAILIVILRGSAKFK